MFTFIIIGICFFGALIPLSRLAVNIIKRNDKYSDDFKHKIAIYQNIFNIVCIVVMLILFLVLNASDK